MSERPPSVVVLGQKGLALDVVRHALGLPRLSVIDLVSMEGDAAVTVDTVVAVLVNATEADWRQADDLGARVVLVSDRGIDASAAVDAELEGLVDVVATVAAGGSYLTSAQASEAIERLRRTPLAGAGVPSLTPRELDILASIERGDVVKQTARRLGISERTVQDIQSRLFRKLGARNRAQAVTRAHELGCFPAAERSGE